MSGKVNKNQLLDLSSSLKSLKEDFVVAWGEIKEFGYAIDCNPEKDAAVEILQSVSYLKENAIIENGLENGLSGIEYEIDSSDDLNTILGQFDTIINEVENYQKERFPDVGSRVKFDNGDLMENLSANRFRERVEEVVPNFAEYKEDVKDWIVQGTAYQDVENLFYMNSLTNWDEEEREELFEQIRNYDTTLISLVEYASEYNMDAFERFKIEYNFDGYSNPEKLVKSIMGDMERDIKANNFKGAARDITTLINLYDICENQIMEEVSDLDLSIPSNSSDALQDASAKFDLIYGVGGGTATGFELENAPNDDMLDELNIASTDIVIVESDGKYYVGSSSSEMNMEKVAYAYLTIDDDIPALVAEKLKLGSREGYCVDKLKEHFDADINAVNSYNNKSEEEQSQKVDSPKL